MWKTSIYADLLNFWNDFGCMSLLRVSSVPRVDLLLLELLRYCCSLKAFLQPVE
jgi:hypothetical protein